jgi:hypothetical protein
MLAFLVGVVIGYCAFVSDGRKGNLCYPSYMSVDAVRLEMVRECTKAQLVKDTSLVDAQVVLNFAVAPVRQVLGIVVDLKPPLVFGRWQHGSYIVASDHALFRGGKKASQFCWGGLTV